MEVSRCGNSLWRSLAVVIAMTAWCHTSFADTLWFEGQQDPIYGIVESTAGGKVQFQRTSDGSTFERIEIDSEKVRLMVKNFDSVRLESLEPGNWNAWHEYAEELFVQRKDPVAHHLAMRLWVVVLGNSQDAQQREAALSNLVGLARSNEERRKLQQLQYLETGKRVTVVNPEAKETMPAMDQRKSAAMRIKSVRNGQGTIDTNDEDLKRVVSYFEGTCSWQELIQISRSNRIGNRSLRLLVELELALLSGDKNGVADQYVEWHALAVRVGSSTLKLPTVSNVTEFDPLATKFENGKWTRR
jgi:hypothetical protein